MSEIGQRWWWHWSLVSPLLGVVFAFAVQGTGAFREAAAARPAHLAAAIAAVIPGWTGREVPLGPNEFVAGAVEQTLNYDEVLNREYTRAEESFGVYVAYWGPGKMPTRFVASHTPDRCWTENGLRCVEMKFKAPVAVEGAPLHPVEWRRFEAARGQRPIYVLYWHLVEGRLYDYGDRFNAVPSPWLWIKDAVQQVLLGSREQYFIRLTSGEPLENLWEDPGFAEILRSLGQLGLFLPSPSGPRGSAS